MPEPLKNRYSREYLQDLAASLKRHHPEFNDMAFVNDVLADSWSALELKARMRRIAETLHAHLPVDFATAAALLSHSSRDFSGFEAMFFPEYVGLYGLEHHDLSMQALQVMTRYSSAEFAVRPFIVKDQPRMMGQMLEWSRSPDHHLRRLASEGCRPRLPWAMALPDFKRDPSPILPILHNLRNDPSDYVYRSVANNLNDISRDHPDLVLQIANRWKDESATTAWVVKHACRSLLRQGDRRALDLFGFDQPDHVQLQDFELAEQVAIGDRLRFAFTLASDVPLGPCRLEYRIHYLKSNGELSGKVFKISESNITARVRRVEREHSFRPVSTRVLYRGGHAIDVLVNGHKLASGVFELV